MRLVQSCDRRNGREGMRVSVCDTGTGISPEHKKRIFEPFFSTKEMKGTGLGLWISRGIVQKYDGTIGFRSMRVGNGSATTFSVFIPTAAASSPAAAAAVLVA